MPGALQPFATHLIYIYMLKLALVITDAVTVICILGLALVGNYAENMTITA